MGALFEWSDSHKIEAIKLAIHVLQEKSPGVRMNKMVVGLFRDYEEAGAAVHDLHKSGFSRREVSMVSREGSKAFLEPKSDTAEGAGTGAALGGATGMILGLAALAVPGIGPIVAAGPIATALAGAGIGAAAGGMIGALSRLGIPEAEAGSLIEAVQYGGTLVAVRCDEHDVGKVEAILNRHGASDIDERSASVRNGQWVAGESSSHSATHGDQAHPSSPAVASQPVRVYEVADRTTLDAEFRRHFATTFYMRGGYEEFGEAYHYGQLLGSDPRYRDADWHKIEAEARAGWELKHPGTWDRMKEAVRHAWDYVRGRR